MAATNTTSAAFDPVAYWDPRIEEFPATRASHISATRIYSRICRLFDDGHIEDQDEDQIIEEAHRLEVEREERQDRNLERLCAATF